MILHEMTKYGFQISYDTDETSDHTIDAQMLGESIVNMAKLVRSADSRVNLKDSELKIDVKAHSEGSFVVEFVTYIQSGLVNPLEVLGLIAGSTAASATVIGAIQQVRSRKIKLVEKDDTNNGTSNLQLDDGSKINLPSEVADLLVTKTFRDSVEKVINSPLEGTTNAKFIVKNEDGDETLTLTQEQSVDFKTIPLNVIDEVEEIEEATTVRFTKLNFEGTAGWQVRLADESLVPIVMKDDAFFNKINKNDQQFVKGDLYSVKLKTVKKHRHGTSPTYKRYILQVVRNITQSTS